MTTAGQIVAELEIQNGKFDAGVTSSSRTFDQAMASIRASGTQAERSVQRSSSAIVASTGAVGQATRNLGFQIADVGASLSGGSSPLVVFGQQAPQFVQAFQDISAAGANLGTVLRNIALPGFIAVVSILGTLISKSLESADADNQHKKAKISLNQAIDDLNQSLSQEISTTRRSIFLGQAKANRDYEAAKAARTRAAANLAVALSEARAEQQRSTNTSGLSGQRGEVASLGGADNRYAGQVADLEKRLAVAQAYADKSAGAVTLASARRVQAQVAEANDASAAATGRYERRVDSLNAMLKRGQITLAQYGSELDKTTKRRDAALEATKKGAGASTALADAEGRLAAADTSVQRAQAQLAVTRAKAGAELKAGTITQAEYSARIRDGQNALDAARESTKEHAKATRDAAAAIRELDSDLKDLQDRFDPAAASARNLADVLTKIQKLRSAGRISVAEAGDYTLGALEAEAKKRAEAQNAQFKELFGSEGQSFLSDNTKSYDTTKNIEFEAKADAENRAQDIRTDNVRSLADMYESLFQEGTGGIWRNFKDQGLRTLALIAAQATLTSFGKGGGGVGSLLGNLSKGLSAAFGGGDIPKLAGGGTIGAGGMGGVDQNVLSVNGVPKAMISANETLSVVNPNMRAAAPSRGNTTVVHQHFNLDARGALTTPQFIKGIQGYVDQSGAQAAATGAREGARRAVTQTGPSLTTLGTTP